MSRFKSTSRTTALTTLLVLSTSWPAMAATPPNAGTLLQSQTAPPTQEPGKIAPDLQVPQQQEEQKTVEQQKILVKGIHITGQNIYSEGKLLPIVKNFVGKELTLDSLNGVAAKVTQYFRAQGYVVATAYLPPQDIKDGIVTITVVVGQYGKIDIRNSSTLQGKTVSLLLSTLKSGDYIQGKQLDRTLLLLSDIPGVNAKATLAPGKAPGTADLLVDIKDGTKLSGTSYMNNTGNRFTGKNQLGVSMNMNDVSGHGDLLTVGGLYAGSGLNDYNVNYLLPVDGQGTKIGVGYSHLHYALGQEYASLEASGVANTTNIFGSFTLSRSRDFDLNARAEFDHKSLTDYLDSQADSTSDKGVNSVTVGVNGDGRDRLGGGGLNSFALNYTEGHLDLDSAYAQSQDATVNTAGNYGKTVLNLNRIQAINNRTNLYLTFNGQLANKNLDGSEKLTVGGPSGVRAYPSGEACSDEGYVFTGEFRWNLPTPSFQLAAFYDSGKAILSKDPSGTDANEHILSGAGLGLIWTKANNYSIRLDCAWKVSTSYAATADTDSNSRLWLQATKYF